MNLSSLSRLSTPGTPKQMELLFEESLPQIMQRISLGLALLPSMDEGVDAWMHRVSVCYRSTTGEINTSWNAPHFKNWREDTRKVAVFLADRLGKLDALDETDEDRDETPGLFDEAP